MSLFTFEGQPKLCMLSKEQIERIFEDALDILEETGVHYHQPWVLDFLAQQGARIDEERMVAHIPRDMVKRALETVPGSFDLYDANGTPLHIGGDTPHFDPGSATIRMMESDGTLHKTVSDDLVRIARLTDELDHIELLSTAITPDDIDVMHADSYRVLVLLKNTTKPFLAGAFSSHGLEAIHELLSIAAGGDDELKAKPRSAIDICCTAPLKWTEISCQNMRDATRWDMPVELLSVPIIGAAAPATLAGCVLLHTVEQLSGITLVQLLNPGNPMVYGGAPMYFDMRTNTTSLNSVEAAMIGTAYSQMGKYLGMPIHTYAGLSDSKCIDAQAGLETALSATIVALAGVNIISGPGVTEFCNTISLEKLVIDDDICGMIQYLCDGIHVDDETLAKDTIEEMSFDGEYLGCDHTLEWFRKEPYHPSSVIDRQLLQNWQAEGGKDAFAHASEIVQEILDKPAKSIVTPEVAAALDEAWVRIEQMEM